MNNKETFNIIDGEDKVDFSNSIGREIKTDNKDLSIREFQTMKQDGDLTLRPQYQRNFVMNPVMSSRLVESILMDVPIPIVYLDEDDEGKYSVIDGQQRLTTFISFLEGKFPDNKEFKLRGLTVYPELNGKKFSDLNSVLQRKIKTATLKTIVIKKESDKGMKFDIFERLNTGSIHLNEDELRNTIYRGNYISLLAELEENETFHKLINNLAAKKRMKYRGMILRFFSLANKTHLHYKPSMKQFCNNCLVEFKGGNMTSKVKNEYRKQFLKVVDVVYTVFGTKAFRRFEKGNDNKPNGKWEKKVNMSLFDVQMCGFFHYSKKEIIQNSDEIREAMLFLMTGNEMFINAIEMGTNSKDQLQTRFKIWLRTLESIITKQKKEKRFFSYTIKKKLFEKDSTCNICSQNINEIDDAEVDHVIPFSKGGKTIIENAQITHRFCNRSKGSKIIHENYTINSNSEQNIDLFNENILFSEEDKLVNSSKQIKYLYYDVRLKLLKLDDLKIKNTKRYTSFTIGKNNVVDIIIQKQGLKVCLNISKGNLIDNHKITRDVSKIGHLGNGDYEIVLKSDDNLDVFLELVKQTIVFQKRKLYKRKL